MKCVSTGQCTTPQSVLSRVYVTVNPVYRNVAFNFFRPRTKLSNREDNDSPSILRKTDNYTWVPKDCSLNAVSVDILHF